jgi:hypothetical protein
MTALWSNGSLDEANASWCLLAVKRLGQMPNVK